MENKPLTILTISLDIVWESPSENVEKLHQILSQISGADIIVLPEMWNTGFTNNIQLGESMDGPSLSFLKKWAQKLDIAIAGSMMIKDQEGFFNRWFFCKPDGEIETYDKRHLFSLSGENLNFQKGTKPLIVKYKGWKILAQVCYDLRFPVWMRQKKDYYYDLILLVANWPEKRSYPWKQLGIARAIENQAFVVCVNRTGIDGDGLSYDGAPSYVLDALGESILPRDQQREYVKYDLNKESLEKIRNSFPFLQDSDEFWVVS
jgi:omega-amidase